MAKSAIIGSKKEGVANDNSLSQLVENYLSALRRLKYSEKTIYSYDRTLKKLLLFLAAENIVSLPEVTLEILEKFRGAMLAEGLKTGTVAVTVRVIRGFFNYLECEGIIFENPAYKLRSPQVEKRLQYVPTKEEMRQLLAAPDVSMATGIRDRTILEVAYATGIRLEELTRLKVFDVDLKNSLLRIYGKGRKERMVPLTQAAKSWLERYLSGARNDLLRYNLDEESLWIGKHKKGMKHAAFGVRIGEYSKTAGLKKRISPHAIRRACATHLLQNGAHPVQVQMLLGHKDVKTLSHYINVELDEIKATHSRSKPGR